ncbi:hypothetical protein N7507_002761 [Penicillium longicatenatum]|nr:hypothetical protein N7507_002761 [Penicillium longicatenatum]
MCFPQNPKPGSCRTSIRDITKNYGGSSSKELARYYLEIIHALSFRGRDPEDPIPEDEFAEMVELIDMDGPHAEQFRTLVESPPGEEGGSGKSLFFVKEKGRYSSIGFSGAGVQDGDILAIPYGFNQTFVLRRLSYPSHVNDHSRFKVVDMAYVAGLKRFKSPRSPKTPLVQTLISRPRFEGVIC